jgi:DNA-binding NarL/FixJ family response regulator
VNVERIRVLVRSFDSITSSGLVNYLQPHEDIQVLTEPSELPTVLVLALERTTAAKLHKLTRGCDGPGAVSPVPAVLVVDEVNHEELLIAIDAGVVAVLPRAVVTAERLQRATMVAATGGAVMPNDLLGGLLKHFERLQREVLIPNGLSGLGFTVREIEVLRLMADGLDTAEIAERMAYSDRTIKGIVASAAKRLNLRNRTHAVAYACRSGVI